MQNEWVAPEIVELTLEEVVESAELDLVYATTGTLPDDNRDHM